MKFSLSIIYPAPAPPFQLVILLFSQVFSIYLNLVSVLKSFVESLENLLKYTVQGIYVCKTIRFLALKCLLIPCNLLIACLPLMC